MPSLSSTELNNLKFVIRFWGKKQYLILIFISLVIRKRLSGREVLVVCMLAINIANLVSSIQNSFSLYPQLVSHRPAPPFNSSSLFTLDITSCSQLSWVRDLSCVFLQHPELIPVLIFLIFYVEIALLLILFELCESVNSVSLFP